ncbi:MAG: Jag N-terminal domain-containing protein, partial [Akkermansia sp.]|nr:Jag N-terminal domain-containing protein [Akkermansia sp.]
MMKYIETTGRSEEDAIAAALFQLGLERYDVSIEVMERAKSGFLGFGGNPARVRVGYEEENGKPVPMKDIFQEELFAAPKKEEKPAPAPKAEPKVEVKAEVKPEPKPEVVEEPEVSEAPVVEETILAAKPGWEAPKRREKS